MWKTVFECSDGIERPNFALDTFIVKGGIEKGEAYNYLFALEIGLRIIMIVICMMT